MGWQSNILIPRVGRGQFGLGWTLQTLAKSGLVSTETLILSFFTRLVWNFQVCYVFRRLFLPAKRLSVNIGSRQSKARINIATPHHSIKQVQSPPPAMNLVWPWLHFVVKPFKNGPRPAPVPRSAPGPWPWPSEPFSSNPVRCQNHPDQSRLVASKRNALLTPLKSFFVVFFVYFLMEI